MAAPTTEERRTDRTYGVLLIYTHRAYDHEEEVETAAVDLMADLLHLLDRDYGITPEDAHARAWEHFIAEKEGDE